MKHLRGIDGLRAVAVLAVVAYHAGLPVPAGFVGVDVFFVISGYLITRLLHDEILATGKIDFLGFYARRARRILPALAVVVLATLAFSALMLPPAELQQTLRSAAASLLFVGNVFFASMPTGYFDPSPEAMPLLHLWSLGVEEQFYLVWPVVLILARRKPVVALASLAVVSLALSLWLPSQAAFYQMPARAWELALGGLVALRPVAVPKGSAWVGLSLVLLACFVPLGHFPGVGVIGAALLIAAIQNGERCAALENRPMVAVGLISYSLYLWHWPLLVLGGLMELPALALVAVAFLLAAVSYRWVETPCRRIGRPRLTVASSAVAMVLASVLLWQQGKQPVEPVDPVPSIYTMGCDSYKTAMVRPCAFGPKDAKHTVVIVGDSVGLHWFPALYMAYPDWRIVAVTRSSCPMVDAPYKDAQCAQWRKLALKVVAQMHPDMVLVGSTSTYPFTPEQWTDGTQRVLQTLSGVHSVRILRATPQLHGGASSEAVYHSLVQAASQFPNARVVDMNEYVCPKGHCQLRLGGLPVFRDGQHLTRRFSASLAPQLASHLN